MDDMNTRPVPKIPSFSAVKYDPEEDGNETSIVRFPFMNALCMNGGDGQHSYANNSLLQRKVINKARPVLVKTISKMLSNLNFPAYMQVADLGCSSGPNTFLVVSEIVNTIDTICQKTSREPPEFTVFLNDLPENDFNTTFKLIRSFHGKLKQNKQVSCFISGVPGSFYSRLFLRKSLHFIHSSYSLHWLSKVPEKLEHNKGTVYITSSSPVSVYKSYLRQFQRDFSSFLRLRSEEMVSGGCMVLTFLGRSASDPLHRDCCHFWTLLSDSLRDLVSEGHVKEADVDSYNMPFYDPDEAEVREMIRNEGSFDISKIETFEYDMSESSNENLTLLGVEAKTGQKEANYIRSITEPMLVADFGDAIIDSLFARYSKHVVQHASCGDKTTITIVVSLSKKY